MIVNLGISARVSRGNSAMSLVISAAADPTTSIAATSADRNRDYVGHDFAGVDDLDPDEPNSA